MLNLLPLTLAVAIQGASKLSPEVHTDHTVTFRISSPNAKKVSVSIEGNGNLDLAQRSDGIWEGTSKRLSPDIYGYTFNVDGVATYDPMNPAIKVNLLYVSNMVTVPGTPPELWEVQNVPRGEVHHHFYHSGVIGDDRDFFVYTPAGYSASKGKLPVLYLLHGFSDTAEGWTVVGKANVILDNLIAQKKIKPMIVVMPLGYGVSDFASRTSTNFGDRNRTLKNCVDFRSALLTEVIPMVEKSYRASNKRDDRAIAGLSMGGSESLYTGLTTLDKFAYVGAFSSAPLPVAKPGDALPNLNADTSKGLKVLWMSCGTGDGLIGFQRGFSEWLTNRGVTHATSETGGGHEWLLWRRNLAAFTQKIFR